MFRKLLVFSLIFLFFFVTLLPATAKENRRLGVINGYVNGRLVFPEIPFWNRPGGPNTGGTIKKMVKSGTPVEIVQELRVNKQVWYKVNTYCVKKGISGWVPSYIIRSP